MIKYVKAHKSNKNQSKTPVQGIKNDSVTSIVLQRGLIGWKATFHIPLSECLELAPRFSFSVISDSSKGRCWLTRDWLNVKI